MLNLTANFREVASVAYAKLRAVYPRQAETEQMLVGCDPNALVSDPGVCAILGTVSTADHEAMYFQLRKFLESRERSTASRKEKKELVFWPLIKVVRVCLKSDTLSIGLVLVDLVPDEILRDLIIRGSYNQTRSTPLHTRRYTGPRRQTELH